MTKVRIVFWRDIPVHVKARNGDTRRSYPLSPRFQATVHRAAYRARAISGDEYSKEWRLSDWCEKDEGVDLAIAAVVAQLEASYSDVRLDKLARNKGYDPDGD